MKLIQIILVIGVLACSCVASAQSMIDDTTHISTVGVVAHGATSNILADLSFMKLNGKLVPTIVISLTRPIDSVEVSNVKLSKLAERKIDDLYSYCFLIGLSEMTSLMSGGKIKTISESRSSEYLLKEDGVLWYSTLIRYSYDKDSLNRKK